MGRNQTVEPYVYCHGYFGHCQSIIAWSHLFMFQPVTNDILGSNDWIEGMLVAKYPTHLYKFFLMIEDLSCKQRIYATLKHYFLGFCVEIWWDPLTIRTWYWCGYKNSLLGSKLVSYVFEKLMNVRPMIQVKLHLIGRRPMIPCFLL